MVERTFETPCGVIHYWMNVLQTTHTLVFLPGLTADHRLFERQIAHFAGKTRLLVWDAPGHGASRPFRLDFTLADKALWLGDILERERIMEPVLVGQSMGGYVAQSFLQHFPGWARGFISIDSAPLGRSYMTAAELWALKRMEPVYRRYPWKLLLRSGTEGVAVTAYGRALMRRMMRSFEGRQDEYALLAGHGFRILAEAVEADLPYRIDCPALLICGEKDRAGSAKRYNRAWHEKTGIPIVWLKGAGHNANTDRAEEVDRLIEQFLDDLN